MFFLLISIQVPQHQWKKSEDGKGDYVEKPH